MQPDSRPGPPVLLVVEVPATNTDVRMPLVKGVGTWWLPGGRVGEEP